MLLIHGLSGGGSEKVAIELTRHWAEGGYPTALVTLAPATDDRYQVAPGVERIALDCVGDSRGLFQAIASNRLRARRIREAASRFEPDVVVSFNDRTNVLAAIALRGRNFPLIVSERADPAMNAAGKTWSTLRRLAYPTADSIVVLSEGYRGWATHVGRGKPVHVVTNACWSIDDGADRLPSDEAREPIVLGLGRLSDEKGFDRLIDAFARVAPSRPGWRLRIVGEGPLRDALARRASEAGFAERFELLPWTDDPGRHLRSARIFALPSRFEGFSNALVDALAAGLPAVAFRGSRGTEDVLRGEIDGALAPPDDVTAFSHALDRLMGDDAFRVACGQRAVDARTRFSPASVFARWEAVLAEASARRRR